MRLTETDLTDTSMCHPGLPPDPFSDRKLGCDGKRAPHFPCVMDPPKLAVSKYGAFISVLSSAGAT